MSGYDPEAVWVFILRRYDLGTTESCYLVTLDADGSPNMVLTVATSRGFRVRVLTETIVRIARGRPFVLAHNHPSGLLEPSEADVSFTKDLKTRLGSQFVDHLVITRKGYRSIL